MELPAGYWYTTTDSHRSDGPYPFGSLPIIRQYNQRVHTESGGLGGLHRSFSSACYWWSKEKYALRSGVESTLSQGVRRFDLRQSRYLGLARTHRQQLLTATAMNVVQVLA